VASVTADSNIWVSAFNFRGKPHQLVQKAIAGEVQIDISGTIIEEVTRTLREKFRWSEAALREAGMLMREVGHVVTPTQTLDVVKADPDDNRIVECAVAAHSDYIVTGDKDLLRLRVCEGIPIVRMADLLAIIEKGGGVKSGSSLAILPRLAAQFRKLRGGFFDAPAPACEFQGSCSGPPLKVNVVATLYGASVRCCDLWARLLRLHPC
jgi:uncharacterized protein